MQRAASATDLLGYAGRRHHDMGDDLASGNHEAAAVNAASAVFGGASLAMGLRSGVLPRRPGRFARSDATSQVAAA